jgi:uncharacterized delta-60 repeat protein
MLVELQPHLTSHTIRIAMKSISFLFFILISSSLFSSTLSAQGVVKDQHYGDNGRFITSVHDYSDYSIATSLCSDGSTLTSGFYIRDIARPYTGAGYLMKVRPNGLLDNRFGNSGFFRDTMPETMSFGNAIEMPGGRILVTANGQLTRLGSVSYPMLYRLLPNGRPDTLFGKGGKMLFLDNPRVGLGEIRRLPNGKYIVSCGYYDGNAEFDMALMRLDKDGRPDSTFGINGLRVYSNPVLYDLCEGMEVQSDGKIVMIGRRYMKYDQSVVTVMRINTDGSLDSSFGTNGRTILRSPLGEGYCAMQDIEIQPDGRILTTGYAYSGSVVTYTNVFMIARFMSNGQFDSSFGGDGIVTPDVAPGEEHSVALAVQNDGKIIVAGNIGAPFPVFQSYGGLLRLLPDGTVDSTFGVNGVILEDMSGTEGQGVSDVLLTPDNGIVLCGHGYEDNWNGYFNLIQIKYTSTTISSVEQRDDEGTLIYPNPTNTYFRLNIPNDILPHILTVSLYDIMGNVVATCSPTGINSTANIANGQYILRVDYQVGNSIKSKSQMLTVNK